MVAISFISQHFKREKVSSYLLPTLTPPCLNIPLRGENVRRIISFPYKVI